MSENALDAWVLELMFSWLKYEDVVESKLWNVCKLWQQVCANLRNKVQIPNLWGGSNFRDKQLQSLAHMLSGYTDKRYPLTLDISDCVHISNGGVGSLPRVKMLKELKMSRCHKLTDQGLSHIFSLTSLVFLDLSGCVMRNSALQGLSNLTSLKTLVLHGNRISCGIFRHVNNLSQLESLDVSRSDVQMCGASTCACSAAPSALKALTSLNLRGCTLLENRGLVCVISKWTSLQDLNLSWCANLSDLGVSTLTALKNLKLLKVYGCGKVTSNMANVGFPKELVVDVKWAPNERIP